MNEQGRQDGPLRTHRAWTRLGFLVDRLVLDLTNLKETSMGVYLGWVGDADWQRLMQLVARIDANCRQIPVLNEKLNALLSQQAKYGAQIMVDLTAANQEISRNTDVTGSVKTLLSTLTQMVADLKNSTSDPAAQQAIDALVAQLKANDDSLSQSVTDNTPAAAPAAT